MNANNMQPKSYFSKLYRPMRYRLLTKLPQSYKDQFVCFFIDLYL